MDPDALSWRLDEAFGDESSGGDASGVTSSDVPSDGTRRASSDAPSGGGEPGERRVVVRQALDLADAGRWAETHDGERLTVDRVVGELEQAPSGEGLADRWNWWIGALELAHGGFEPFAVRSWRAE